MEKKKEKKKRGGKKEKKKKRGKTRNAATVLARSVFRSQLPHFPTCKSSRGKKKKTICDIGHHHHHRSFCPCTRTAILKRLHWRNVLPDAATLHVGTSANNSKNLKKEFMYGSTTHINRPDYSPAPMQIQKKKKSASDSFHNTMCTRQKKKKDNWRSSLGKQNKKEHPVHC